MLTNGHTLLRRSATAEPILDKIGTRPSLSADRSKAGRLIVAKIEGAALALALLRRSSTARFVIRTFEPVSFPCRAMPLPPRDNSAKKSSPCGTLGRAWRKGK